MIYLSPSKQPKNNYAAGNTNEQKQMYRVAAELQKILEKEYICTVYTAPTDLFLSLDGRALDAYNRHADVYLAIHSNSDGSKKKKSYGAVGYYQPKNLTALAIPMCGNPPIMESPVYSRRLNITITPTAPNGLSTTLKKSPARLPIHWKRPSGSSANNQLLQPLR